MRTVKLKNGFLTMSESKAVCPHCNKLIPLDLDAVCERLEKSKRMYIRKRCECNKFVGLTSDYRGDLVAFPLKRNRQEMNGK